VNAENLEIIARWALLVFYVFWMWS